MKKDTTITIIVMIILALAAAFYGGYGAGTHAVKPEPVIVEVKNDSWYDENLRIGYEAEDGWIGGYYYVLESASDFTEEELAERNLADDYQCRIVFGQNVAKLMTFVNDMGGAN